MTIEIESHKAALVAQQAEFDKTLEELKTQLFEKNAALTAEVKKREDEIKTMTDERDALNASLAQRIAAQDDLALRAKAAYEAAAAAFATFGAILGEALTPAEQKAAAEREAKRAKLQAELDALK